MFWRPLPPYFVFGESFLSSSSPPPLFFYFFYSLPLPLPPPVLWFFCLCWSLMSWIIEWMFLMDWFYLRLSWCTCLIRLETSFFSLDTMMGAIDFTSSFILFRDFCWSSMFIFFNSAMRSLRMLSFLYWKRQIKVYRLIASRRIWPSSALVNFFYPLGRFFW